MEYVYAAMLLHKAGKDINEDGVKKVLDAAGIKVDSAKVKALVAALEGVNVEDAIKNASAVAVASAPAASGNAPSEASSDAGSEKKEEPKEEKKEEEAAAGLGALFG